MMLAISDIVTVGLLALVGTIITTVGSMMIALMTAMKRDNKRDHGAVIAELKDLQSEVRWSRSDTRANHALIRGVSTQVSEHHEHLQRLDGRLEHFDDRLDHIETSLNA